MNSLSWLIYLAGVTQGIGAALGGLSFLSGIVGFAGIVGGIAVAIACNDGIEVGNLPNLFKNFRQWGISLCITLFLVSRILPDRPTILAIAASEIGQKVVQSEQVTSVIDPSVELLKTWIQDQTAQIKAKAAE